MWTSGGEGHYSGLWPQRFMSLPCATPIPCQHPHRGNEKRRFLPPVGSVEGLLLCTGTCDQAFLEGTPLSVTYILGFHPIDLVTPILGIGAPVIKAPTCQDISSASLRAIQPDKALGRKRTCSDRTIGRGRAGFRSPCMSQPSLAWGVLSDGGSEYAGHWALRPRGC